MTDQDASKPADNRLMIAALLGEKPWSWHWRFNPQLHNHMHALGVVAANYNSLENTLSLLMYHYSGKLGSMPQLLFSLLNNNHNRLTMLRCYIDENEFDPAVKEYLTYFAAAYDICAENRNFLMHGMTQSPSDSQNLLLSKFARRDPTRLNYLELTADDIREVADDMFNFDVFGLGIFLWLRARPYGGEFKMSDGSIEKPEWPVQPAMASRLKLLDSKPSAAPPTASS